MRCRMWLLAFTVGIACLVSHDAEATDQLLPGTRLVIRDDSSSNQHLINLIIKSPTLLAPGPNTLDDPRTVGATLTIASMSGEAATLAIPPSNVPGARWLEDGRTTTYRFSDTDPLAPVWRATIKDGSIINIRTNTAGITLDELSQQAVGIILTSGSHRYCTMFSGAAIRRDEQGSFFARGAAAPSSCPVCGNGITEFGEQCDDGNGWPLDGCSRTCQAETATSSCVAATIGEMQAATVASTEFQSLLGIAAGLHYSTDLVNPQKCSEGGLTTGWTAQLNSNTNQQVTGLLVFRPDFPEMPRVLFWHGDSQGQHSYVETLEYTIHYDHTTSPATDTLVDRTTGSVVGTINGSSASGASTSAAFTDPCPGIQQQYVDCIYDYFKTNKDALDDLDSQGKSFPFTNIFQVFRDFKQLHNPSTCTPAEGAACNTETCEPGTCQFDASTRLCVCTERISRLPTTRSL